jgi:hypothetical protein
LLGKMERGKNELEGGRGTHGMNTLLGLQPTTILIHILLRPFNKRESRSIMIHIPPYPRLGENERFLLISRLRSMRRGEAIEAKARMNVAKRRSGLEFQEEYRRRQAVVRRKR